jgi:hypothetical protein
MKKIPKLLLVTAVAAFTSTSSCSKKEIKPEELEFYCKDVEKTIQTFLNQEGIVRKVEYTKNNPKEKDSSKNDFLIISSIFVLTFDNPADITKKTTLVPSIEIPKELQIENKKIVFSGQLQNCLIINYPNPAVEYDSFFDFTIGNKIIITKINKN